MDPHSGGNAAASPIQNGSGGVEGEEPTPEAKAYIDAWYQIPGMSDEAEILKIGKAALENLAENMWFIGLVAPAPDVRFHRNNMRGVDLVNLPPLVMGWSGAFTWSKEYIYVAKIILRPGSLMKDSGLFYLPSNG